MSDMKNVGFILKCISCFVAVVCLLAISIFCISNSVVNLKEYNKKMKLTYKYTTATFVDYKEYYDVLAGKCYNMYFKFVADDGKEYVDVWDKPVKKEQDAKNLIGMEINIFANHETGITSSSMNISSMPGVLFAIGGFVLLIVTYVINLKLVYFLLRLRYIKILNILEVQL